MCVPNQIQLDVHHLNCIKDSHTWYDSIDSKGDVEYRDEEFVGERV